MQGGTGYAVRRTGRGPGRPRRRKNRQAVIAAFAVLLAVAVVLTAVAVIKGKGAGATPKTPEEKVRILSEAKVPDYEMCIRDRNRSAPITRCCKCSRCIMFSLIR